jgi:hypothetical protein
MEMGMFHPRWRRLRTERADHGVCQAPFPPTFATSANFILTHNARWAHEICADDNEERAITVGTMNEIAYVCQAWLPLIVWQQVDEPQYQKGYITVSCLSVLLIISAFVVRHLDNTEKARKYGLYLFYSFPPSFPHKPQCGFLVNLAETSD